MLPSGEWKAASILSIAPILTINQKIEGVKYIVYDGSNEVLKSNEWDRSGWPIPGSPSCPLRRITISSPCAGVDRKPFLTTSIPKAGRIAMSRGHSNPSSTSRAKGGLT